MQLKKLITTYYSSNDFNMLRDKSKQDYKYLLNVLMQDVGSQDCEQLTSKQAKHLYEDWVKRGITFANHVCTVASRVYRYGIDMEYVTINPFANVKRKTPNQRKVVWSKENVIQFLDYCYSDFTYRNIGLIVQMAYEWCQRIGDMRLLKWDSFDFEKKRLHLEQSKRRAEVFLPISDNLFEMLQQQREEFGFQEYVAPRIKPIHGAYEPYGLVLISKIGRKAMQNANLPSELRLMDIRRTGTTEMVEAGVPMGQIMSVTGHANPQSVKPYMKNTFESANNALTTRNMYDKSN
jgi:integrase